MIKLLQGVFGFSGFEGLVMTFREEIFSLPLGRKVKDSKPYLGGKINLNNAILLRTWLDKVIEANKTQCDKCWNFKLNDKVELRGELRCKDCKTVLNANISGE